MMSRVASDLHRHLALEVTRGEKSVAFISINGNGIDLRRADKREFDTEYCIEPIMGTAGIPPTPRHFARIMLGAGGVTWPISSDAARALLHELTLDAADPRSHNVVLLVTKSGNLIGSFETKTDATTAMRYFDDAILIESPVALTEWPAGQIETLRQQVAPSLKAKDPRKLREGVFAMAIAAPKVDAPAPRKIESTKKERPARADGPVAKVRAYVETNAAKFRSGELTKVQAVDALVALGVVKGTIGVQLPKALNALKIVAQKGSRAKVKANGEAKPAKVAKEKPAAAKPKAPAKPKEKKAKGKKK